MGEEDAFLRGAAWKEEVAEDDEAVEQEPDDVLRGELHHFSSSIAGHGDHGVGRVHAGAGVGLADRVGLGHLGEGEADVVEGALRTVRSGGGPLGEWPGQ